MKRWYHLAASLEKVIQTWIEDNAEREETGWPDLFVGEETSDMMALAALAVLFACAESQQYAKREGFFEEGE